MIRKEISGYEDVPVADGLFSPANAASTGVLWDSFGSGNLGEATHSRLASCHPESVTKIARVFSIITRIIGELTGPRPEFRESENDLGVGEYRSEARLMILLLCP